MKFAVGISIATAEYAYPARAQRTESSLDLGVLALRYADSANESAVAITPAFVSDLQLARVEGTATLSAFTSGGWSAQGALYSSVFTQRSRNLLGELEANVGGSTHEDGTRTGKTIVTGRAHFTDDRTGAFAGAGIGRTWDGSIGRNLILGELGAWMRYQYLYALATLSPVRVGDSTHYADAQLSFSVDRANVEWSAVAGVRLGGQIPGFDAAAKSWLSVSGVSWLRPWLALVGSGGTYPIDPTQGFPGGRFISLAVRLGRGRSGKEANNSDEALDPPVAAKPPEPAVLIESFVVEHEKPGSITFKVRAPAARRVDLNADFTGWTPLALTESDGVWSVAVVLKSGTYQMNIRVDGEKWVVPPGLLPMKDEFGGSVGLLIVE